MMEVQIKGNTEVWLPVTGRPKYEVSNMGRVRSLPHKRRGRNNSSRSMRGQILAPVNNGRGYLAVPVRQNSAREYVHRLVAEAFIPNPENKPQVNHINGIKSDNRSVNLEWVTAMENIRHSIDTGLKKNIVEGSRAGVLNGRCVLTEDVVREIRTSNESLKKLAKKYGVVFSTIAAIKKGRLWKHLA